MRGGEENITIIFHTYYHPIGFTFALMTFRPFRLEAVAVAVALLKISSFLLIFLFLLFSPPKQKPIQNNNNISCCLIAIFLLKIILS